MEVGVGGGGQSAPWFPFPLESWAAIPVPSSSFYVAARPAKGTSIPGEQVQVPYTPNALK